MVNVYHYKVSNFVTILPRRMEAQDVALLMGTSMNKDHYILIERK